jgi:hypothetical protein
VLLERDDNFPDPAELEAELTAVRDAVRRGGAGGTGRRGAAHRAVRTTRGSAGRREDAASGGGRPGARQAGADTRPARERLALGQTALLSALVAGTPAPEGFDRVRLGVQARALAGKRADTVAKVAPELPVVLGSGYRATFLAYAQGHPMRGGYRRDAMEFVEWLLNGGLPRDAACRRKLRAWWRERSGPAPRRPTPAARAARAARRVLLRR